jgi:hypothetical protein
MAASTLLIGMSALKPGLPCGGQKRRLQPARKKKRGKPKIAAPFNVWRRHPDLNRRITVLQTAALPLGYAAVRRKNGAGERI